MLLMVVLFLLFTLCYMDRFVMADGRDYERILIDRATTDGLPYPKID